MVFVYLALRAFHVPILHDEMASYIHFIQCHSFIPFYSHPDANNHILNSALATLSYSVLGNDAFSLRLPNLLVFIVYAVYILKFTKLISGFWTRLGFITVFLFSHNFIEFFAIERGYGLSMAFLMMSIYHLVKLRNSQKVKHHIAFGVAFTLALTANVLLIYTNLTLFALYVFIIIMHYKRQSSLVKTAFFANLFFLSATLVFYIYLLLHYQNIGSLYSGASDGFWGITVKSLVKLILESSNGLFLSLAVFFTLIPSLLILSRVNKIRLLLMEMPVALIFFLLFAANVCALIIGHYLLGINYPDERLALQLFPLLMGAFVFSVEEVKQRWISPYKTLLLIPLFAFPIHFFFNSNLTHSSLWSSESIPERFYHRMEKEIENHPEQADMGGYLMRTLCWSYYIIHGDLNMPHIQTSLYPDTFHHYQIVDTSKSPYFSDLYTCLDSDEATHLSLVKRKRNLNYTSLKHIVRSEKEVVTGEYYNILKDTSGVYLGKTLRVNVEMCVSCDAHPFKAEFVIALKDKNDKVITYERIALNWKRDSYNGDRVNFKDSIFISDVPENTKSLIVYIWNIEKEVFEVRTIDIEIVEVK